MAFEPYSGVDKACSKMNLTGFSRAGKRMEMGGLIDTNDNRKGLT